MEQLIDYAKGINSNDEVLFWLNTTAKKALEKISATTGEVEHVLDFLVSEASPSRLRKMSFKDAKRKAQEWSDANQKKGKGLVDSLDDIELIHDFMDGTKIVRLKTKSSYQREGFLMNHCVGGYIPDNNDCHIYSYRDAKNMPHATFEVRKNNNDILQIKGKRNGPIHPKYIHPILAYLKSIGMNIRSEDMKNLGYFHLHKSHLKFLDGFESAKKQITEINGEHYAF